MNSESLELQAIFNSDHLALLSLAPLHVQSSAVKHLMQTHCKMTEDTASDTDRLHAKLTQRACCMQFAAWVKEGLIADLRCFYDPDKRCLHSVVQLGRCGSSEAVALWHD
jgi:hypothetical protein